MTLEFIAAGAFAALSAIIAWGWSHSHAEARYWQGRYYHLQGIFSDYRRNSLRRDPKTGRYIKRER